MMNTGKDKVKKRVWEKPKAFVLSFKNTAQGDDTAISEGVAYATGKS